jgi:pantetheine-phosphate adenylyltransferase
MVKSFQAVAMGGTFDEIHAGHIVLLSKAFEEGEKVVIGISSDRFADRTKGKNKINHNYKERVANLKRAINSKFGPVIYEITKLDNEYGPAAKSATVNALVASSETAEKIKGLNKIRRKNGLLPLELIVVDMIRAEDGEPISSSRIRAGEINSSGKLLRVKRGNSNKV